MNRRDRKQRLVSEINITPFTDVILVLLVIFMIATPLISQSNIKVELPDAKSGAIIEKKPQAQAEIMITREGAVFLDGKSVGKKELGEKIKILYRGNPELSVLVQADKSVRFQEIVDVLDPLVELGIVRINIAAKKGA